MRRSESLSRRVFVAFTLMICGVARGQTAQVGADAVAVGEQKLRVAHVHYRAAKWDAVHIKEAESEYTNQGGLLYVYLVNEGPKPVNLRFWRYNNHDESYWLLNHFIAWHRLLDSRVEPGAMTVLEINGITRDFGAGTPFSFQFVDDTWKLCLEFKGQLEEEEATISYIRVLPDMQNLEIHLRYSGNGPVQFGSPSLAAQTITEVQWRGQELAGPGNAILRAKVAQALKKSEQLIVGIEINSAKGVRRIYAHRRAFPDFFPIGTWNTESETEEFYRFLSGDHVDTLVKGGKKTDAFYGDIAARFSFRSMVHTGEIVDVDMVRDLADHPAVLCWMLRDEPDWSIDPQMMLLADQIVKHYNSTVPTYINLCRQIKFFEYAPIPDIVCHDHYCVTAPTSSIWPHVYGTRLEETAYYTEDLKRAAEPRPVWVWSQGIADGWSERPKRPIPTPEELAAQLVLNLGRGAKGILWFTYHKGMAEKHPEMRDEMRGWNRVMAVLRDDLQGSEPFRTAIERPEDVDVAALAGWDSLVLCITNVDYKIDPEAYAFKKKRNVRIQTGLPSWLHPTSAVRISGKGVSPQEITVEKARATFQLDGLTDTAIVLLSNQPDARRIYPCNYERLLAQEGKS